MKIRQYCSVCKAEFDMEVVPSGDSDDDPVVWLRCPSCEGYLPKIRDSEEFRRLARDRQSDAATGENEGSTAAATGQRKEHAPVAEATPSPSYDGKSEDAHAAADTAASDEEQDVSALLAETDLASAVPYRPWYTFEVGQVIHHLAWDDFGVVVAKERLPGNRQVVKVRFANAGTVRLIENDGTPP